MEPVLSQRDFLKPDRMVVRYSCMVELDLAPARCRAEQHLCHDLQVSDLPFVHVRHMLQEHFVQCPEPFGSVRINADLAQGPGLDAQKGRKHRDPLGCPEPFDPSTSLGIEP